MLINQYPVSPVDKSSGTIGLILMKVDKSLKSVSNKKYLYKESSNNMNNDSESPD